MMWNSQLKIYSRRTFMNRKGFTLIELLVVIAIVAILAAMIFPVFSEAREKARETTCLSNIKQIGTAFTMYIDDYEGSYPAAIIGSDYIHPFEGDFYCGHAPIKSAADIPRAQYGSYRTQLIPYLKSDKIFFCPSDKGKVSKDSGWEAGKRYTSYHYRYFIGARTVSSPYTDVWAEYDLPEPSKTFICHEYLPFHKGEKQPDATSSRDDPWNWTDKSRFNMVFADGHAKSYATIDAIPWNSETGTYDYHWARIFIGDTWEKSSKQWDLD